MTAAMTATDTPATLQAALCRLHACAAARNWATGKTYDEAWAQCTDPRWLLWLLNATGNLPDKTNEALVCRFAREVLHLNADPRVLACLETREAWIRGEATDEQRAAARDAARDAARFAARSAAGDAARAAARSAAGDAARAAARSAARDAAWDAAWAAARSAAGAAAGSAQCEIIREICPKPTL